MRYSSFSTHMNAPTYESAPEIRPPTLKKIRGAVARLFGEEESRQILLLSSAAIAIAALFSAVPAIHMKIKEPASYASATDEMQAAGDCAAKKFREAYPMSTYISNIERLPEIGLLESVKAWHLGSDANKLVSDYLTKSMGINRKIKTTMQDAKEECDK